jgi:hypothetical protein
MEQLSDDQVSGKASSDLDRYLIRRAAELLSVAGDDSYLEIWKRMERKY